MRVTAAFCASLFVFTLGEAGLFAPYWPGWNPTPPPPPPPTNQNATVNIVLTLNGLPLPNTAVSVEQGSSSSSMITYGTWTTDNVGSTITRVVAAPYFYNFTVTYLSTTKEETLHLLVGDTKTVTIAFTSSPPPQSGVPTNIRGLNTWASRFTSRQQATTFLTAAKNAGYNVILVACGSYGHPDFTVYYNGLPTNGGIYHSTTDPYLQPLVKGTSADWLVEEGHKLGLCMMCFEAVYDVYGLKGKKGFSIALPSPNYEDWKVAQWSNDWQIFWSQHYLPLLKSKGWDGFFWDEYGSEGTACGSQYVTLQKWGYEQLFKNTTALWNAHDILMTVYSSEYVCNYTLIKNLGIRFSVWTSLGHPGPTYYMPSNPWYLPGNDWNAWIYPRYLTTQQPYDYNSLTYCRSQVQDVLGKGAKGCIYWAAWAGDESGAYFTDLAQAFRDLIP